MEELKKKNILYQFRVLSKKTNTFILGVHFNSNIC